MSIGRSSATWKRYVNLYHSHHLYGWHKDAAETTGTSLGFLWKPAKQTLSSQPHRIPNMDICHLEQHLSCFSSEIQVAHSDCWNWESTVQYKIIRARISTQLVVSILLKLYINTALETMSLLPSHKLTMWVRHLLNLSGDEQIFLLFFVIKSDTLFQLIPYLWAVTKYIWSHAMSA